MKTAFGALGWRPVDFWSATLTEFYQAINGWNDANGVEEKPAAPSEDEMAELLEKYGS